MTWATHRTGKQHMRSFASVCCCLWLAACSTLGTNRTAPPFRDATMSLQGAQDTIVAGTTSQAEALATLGPATEIHFDSGYAVWVYRAPSAGPQADRAELVILFAPSGIVKKTRLRPAYANHPE